LPAKVWQKEKVRKKAIKHEKKWREMVQLKYLKMAAAFHLAWPGFMNFSNAFPLEKRRRPIRKREKLFGSKSFAIAVYGLRGVRHLGKQGKLGLFDNSLLISAVFGVSLAICLRFQRHNWQNEFKFLPKKYKTAESS